MDEIDKKILKKIGKKPLSTYQIAKETQISYMTVSSRLYRLQAEGKANMEKADGLVKKHMWSKK